MVIAQQRRICVFLHRRLHLFLKWVVGVDRLKYFVNDAADCSAGRNCSDLYPLDAFRGWRLVKALPHRCKVVDSCCCPGGSNAAERSASICLANFGHCSQLRLMVGDSCFRLFQLGKAGQPSAKPHRGLNCHQCSKQVVGVGHQHREVVLGPCNGDINEPACFFVCGFLHCLSGRIGCAAERISNIDYAPVAPVIHSRPRSAAGLLGLPQVGHHNTRKLQAFSAVNGHDFDCVTIAFNAAAYELALFVGVEELHKCI